MSAFWICHDNYLSYLPRDFASHKIRNSLLQLIAQALQSIPPGISGFLSAIARLVVPVLAAMWAEALAIWPAYRLDRHSQQNLFAEHVFQLHALAFVIPDLGLSLADVDLVGAFLRIQWPVEQVERTIHVQLDILN